MSFTGVWKSVQCWVALTFLVVIVTLTRIVLAMVARLCLYWPLDCLHASVDALDICLFRQLARMDVRRDCSTGTEYY